MFPSFDVLRASLRQVLCDKASQGQVVEGLEAELAALPDRYDDWHAFARRLARLPLRPDWPYVEPDDLDAIWAECDPARPQGVVGAPRLDDCARRAEAGFLGSVCGCVLGKPLELGLSLDEISTALEAIGDWPLADYISLRAVPALGRDYPLLYAESARERLAYVPPDDDLSYPLLGLLLLEQHGAGFTRAHLRDVWLHHLNLDTTFGPERAVLLKAGLNSLPGGDPDSLAEWAAWLNPGEEWCGAVIRVDAYGYACPGRPALAAELAWRDAGFTHRRTGVYGAMFLAAALALAPVVDDRLAVLEGALGFVPRRSRLHAALSGALADVRAAADWRDGYRRIHTRLGAHGFCRIYQELGTLMNTFRFARSVGEGICLQVSQGNDTDSFGARAGALLGLHLGPGHLDDRWLRPFNDDLHTALAWFYERSLSAVARRMGALPGRLWESQP